MLGVVWADKLSDLAAYAGFHHIFGHGAQIRPIAGSRSLLGRSTSPSPLSPVLCRGSLASTLQRGVSADISRIMKSGAPQREGTDAAPQVGFRLLAGGLSC